MAKMQLMWPKSRQGYRVELSRPAGGAAAGTIAAEGSQYETVIAVGTEVDTYNCCEIDGIYRHLASFEPTASGARDFANLFGLLQGRRSYSVLFFIRAVENMRALLRLSEEKDWPTISQWAIQNGKAIRFTADFQINDRPDARPNDRPRFFFQPMTLIDAIYAKFFEDLEAGAAPMRLCARPGCGNWFKYGPGTGHRETAKYCSHKCQGAHSYQKRRDAK